MYLLPSAFHWYLNKQLCLEKGNTWETCTLAQNSHFVNELKLCHVLKFDAKRITFVILYVSYSYSYALCVRNTSPSMQLKYTISFWLSKKFTSMRKKSGLLCFKSFYSTYSIEHPRWSQTQLWHVFYVAGEFRIRFKNLFENVVLNLTVKF